MDFNFKALAAEAVGTRHPRIEELKELPILYVLERAGIAYEEKSDGVYVATNPFRADSNPSFDVFGPSLERWGDFAEGTGGDVLDLLGRFIEAHTGQAPPIQTVKDEAARLLREHDASGWAGPTSGAKKRSFDLVAAKSYLAELAENDAGQDVYRWQQQRKDEVLRSADTDWLVSTFQLRSDGDRILIPYFDQTGELIAYKTRPINGGHVMAAPGTEYGHTLYAHWLDDGSKTVVLCEGESDVWSGTHAAPEYVFMGLPTGAGSRPKQANLLSGRRVILAFDGDLAGRSATLVWSEALAEVGCEVLIAYLPNDYDVSGLSAADIRLTMETALPARPVPADAPVEMPGGVGYERLGQKTPTQISDWTFRPEQALFGDDGVSWSGTIFPMGNTVTLRSQDLSSKQLAVRWSQQNGATWLGSDRDAQLLAALFHSKSTFLPRGRAVSFTGLHDGIIVYPGGKLGQSNYVYVPGKIDIPLHNMVHLEESALGQEVDPLRFVQGFRSLHLNRVTDPILAWLAIAPIRSKLAQFPILAVTGGSGTGKTTLVREFVRHFTATQIGTNLTGTTKFAMLGYMGCTNAFPVWFDEYRPGARRETLTEFNQLLRDAYTGQSSIKGGMGDSWASVREVPVRAPIIVSGEDSFSETSHTERMILVHLPKDGKGDTMPQVSEAAITRFAHDYYDWVRTAPAPVIVPSGPENLPERQRYNLGVLDAGWSLLEAFVSEYHPDVDLGAPDWSLVTDEAEEAKDSNPILDAVKWALEEPRLQQDNVVFEKDNMIHLRPDAFVAAVQRSGAFDLPGGSKAVTKYVISHLGGYRTRVRLGGILGTPAVSIRTVAFRSSLVVSEE